MPSSTSASTRSEIEVLPDTRLSPWRAMPRTMFFTSEVFEEDGRFTLGCLTIAT